MKCRQQASYASAARRPAGIENVTKGRYKGESQQGALLDAGLAAEKRLHRGGFSSILSHVGLVKVQVLIHDALVVNVLLDSSMSTVMHLLDGVVLGVMANLLHALVRFLQEHLGIVIVLGVFRRRGLGCRSGSLGRLTGFRRLRLALRRHHGG